MLTENEECYILVQFLELSKRMGHIQDYAHIPNETFTKSWSVKMRNKKLGVSKGVPDYMVVLNNAILFVEMKRLKGSRTSPEQLQWQKVLSSINNVESVICKGATEAIETIKKYAKIH